MSLAAAFGISLGYLLLLFLVAQFTENKLNPRSKLFNNPYIYALSLAVYCSAWTFYGSVGRASTGNMDFLTIYLGPSLMALLFWFVLRKMIRICKAQRITTLADFISARYGKKIFIGNFVALFATLGIIPYIALQIKALSGSFMILTGESTEDKVPFLKDPALYFTLLLGLFAMLYATRKIQSSERNTGMVMAIAFESFVKLVAFLLVGFLTTVMIYGNWNNLQESYMLFTKNQSQIIENPYTDWMVMLSLSALAVVLLPRQFEVGVVENTNEEHVKKAMWLFPLYLLLINLFVLPIAMAGKEILGSSNPDYYVLALPLHFNNSFMAGLTYIGGFSAASGMIIVSTVALSRMLSNNLMIPFILSSTKIQGLFPNNLKIPVYTRRLNISLVLILSFGYYYWLSDKYTLVSIGLISFAAMAQFAPSVIGGMYWKTGNYKGALTGMIVGFGIWAYVLLLPTLVQAGALPISFMEQGPLGIGFLKPHALFGLEGFSPISVAFIWSLFFNIALYTFVSLLNEPKIQESNQAEIFTQIFKYSASIENSVVWKGTAYIPDIKTLLERFIGKNQTEMSLRQFEYRYSVNLNENTAADSRLINYAEKVLSGIIGSSSARLMVESVAKEEKISMDEVLEILKESQELIRLNKELTRTSEQLKKATQDLQKANAKLKDQDELKDEFLYTVTHELRTPLTSIKAFSEILADNEDMPLDLRQKYLQTIVKESDRMTRLISQVLDLENFESGKHKLEVSKFSLPEMIDECVQSISEVIRQRNIYLEIDLQKLPEVYADKDRLTQVILNLLSNAIKYCHPEEGKIILSAYRLENNIKINVGDNGQGIKDELSLIIFEKFFQARNQTIRKPKGSGLGLAISKKIVQLHQGKIWVETSKWGGARFSFTLPINLRDYD